MKTNLTQPASKMKFTALSKQEMAKIGGGAVNGDMTPKERCEYNHVGYCGACDKDGNFTACALHEA
nr:hypothetical protein [Mucilaginibacter sp. L294]